MLSLICYLEQIKNTVFPYLCILELEKKQRDEGIEVEELGY